MILKMTILGIPLAVVTLTGAFVVSMGAVQVEVNSKSPTGQHVHIVAPGVLLPVGVLMVPKAKIRDATRQLRPWLPAIHAATEELEKCPDGPFVQVDSRREHVKVAKIDGALIIDVDDPSEAVHISIPLRAAAVAFHRLADQAQADGNAPKAQAL